MSEPQTRQLSVGVWAIIIASLVLSIAAVLLHLTKVMDQMEDRVQRFQQVDSIQLQNALNQTQAELNKLTADIAMSDNFNQLKKSMGPPGTARMAPQAPLKTQADNPNEAVAILEQTQNMRAFDEYQAIHPKAQQKQLEEINLSNRELKLAYADLAAELEGRFALNDVMSVLNENEYLRLTTWLFAHNKQYEVMDTTLSAADKSVMKVRVTITQPPAENAPPVETTKIVQMEAIKEGRWWKVAEDTETQTNHKSILAKIKEQISDVRSLQKRVQDGKFKNAEEFQTAWDAFPWTKK